MIVSLHVASGAAMGALVRSRRRALSIGPLLHVAEDRVPHQDIANRRFEITSGAASLLLLALCRGPFDAATLGGVAASAPDLEHVLPWLRPRGQKLFHGKHGWHGSGGFSAPAQLLLAGAILGRLVRSCALVGRGRPR
jgi:hypothetical protein